MFRSRITLKSLFLSILLIISPALAQAQTVEGSAKVPETVSRLDHVIYNIIDATGVTTKLPEHVERVVAAGPPASIFLYSLAPEKMLGWPSAIGQERSDFLGPLAQKLPVIGSLGGRSGMESNIERILALKPDLIIDLGYTNPTNISLAERIRQQTGLAYVLYDGRLEALPKAYREIGRAIGMAKEGDERASWIEKRLETTQAVIAKIPVDQRPRIYYARGPNGLESGSAHSIHAEVIERSGGINVISTESAGSGLAQLSMDQIFSFDPDIIVASNPAFAKMVYSDPIWNKMRAVRDKKVILAPTMPYSWVDIPPSINRVIGIVWLTKQLYPERYPIDLNSDIRDFYQLFYHVDVTDAAIEKMLQQP